MKRNWGRRRGDRKRERCTRTDTELDSLLGPARKTKDTIGRTQSRVSRTKMDVLFVIALRQIQAIAGRD